MSLFPQAVLDSTPKVEAKLDLPRVLSLPRRPVLDCNRVGLGYTAEATALAEYMTEKYSLGPRKSCKCKELGYVQCITTLNPSQAWALREAPRAGGLIGMQPVGAGKSFQGLLMPLAFPDCKRAVLLGKPDQKIHYRNAYLRLREHFHVPSLYFENDLELTIIKPGATALRFVPYSLLSRANATDLLERLNPDLIICDEAHSVSARSSSRTGRLLRYLANQTNIRFCAWSGTLIKKSIRDQAHLMAHALGEGSPMPLDPDDVEAWAAVFDPAFDPDQESMVAQSLYRAFDVRNDRTNGPWWQGGNAPNESVRIGYRKRILETPGVISTSGSSYAGSLTFHKHAVPKLPDTVRAALVDVRELMKRPDGEELVEATEIAMCARNVASGFFFYWAFPSIPCTCKPDVFLPEQRCEHCQFIAEWYDRRKAWHKALRIKLQSAEVHLDSPLLCANAAARAYQDPPYVGELPVWREESWPGWAEIKAAVVADPRVRWIDEFFARNAAEWAKEHVGIVWCQSTAFGRKVAELAGLPYHGGGPEAEVRILAEDGKRSVIASLKAHGIGRDGLQAKFKEQYFPEPPSSGDLWQQNIGRLARPGQEADEIETWVPRHVDEVRSALDNAKREAEFTQSMTGADHWLLKATYTFERGE
jgi:hypothetical protein